MKVEVLIGEKQGKFPTPHAALRITNGKGDWVYSFGRYDLNGGAGTLTKLRATDYIYGYGDPDAANHVKGQVEYRASTGFVLNYSKEDEARIQSYLDAFFADHSRVSLVRDRYYAVPLEYRAPLLDVFEGIPFTCANLVCDALNASEHTIRIPQFWHPYDLALFLEMRNWSFLNYVLEKIAYPRSAH